MKYADETAFGHSLSIARWKPISTEVFIFTLHKLACDNSDYHGNDGIWNTKSVKVDKLQTATVYYVPKRHPSEEAEGKRPSMGTPKLLTLTNPGGKVICMEFVPEPWDSHKLPEENLEAFATGVNTGFTGVTAVVDGQVVSRMGTVRSRHGGLDGEHIPG